jgi:hypothetical protein
LAALLGKALIGRSRGCQQLLTDIVEPVLTEARIVGQAIDELIHQLPRLLKILIGDLPLLLRFLAQAGCL